MSIVSDALSGLTSGPGAPVTAVADLANTIVKRIWQDPAEQAKAEQAIAQMAQTGALAQLSAEAGLLQGQIDVNKIEAASSKLFVSGWRPFLGWVCSIGAAWAFIGSPLVETVLAVAAPEVKLPEFATTEMIGLLTGMLGLYGIRSGEKRKGVV